ncbi:MAG: Grx4 family monothiol glutaredoxin [Deltaproteobacteria bacterium]|nr:Grx4 family monothiol glutaredoxin [Deltaproteobacteria bacterium]
MAISADLKQRIETIIGADRVVLFMKGDRAQPRCGFSAAIVEMLDELLPTYATVDVLADPAIREGIKAFSDWPTIPQLYIGGEFVGGTDITKDLYASGELHKQLGVERTVTSSGPVTVTLTEAAAKALSGAREQEPPAQRFLRLGVNARFQHALSFGPELPGDAATSSQGFDIRVDGASVKRANGVSIDFVTSPQTGFKITNPNEPAKVKQVKVKDLKARLDDAKAKGAPFMLYDVRTKGEHDIARIGGAKLLDDAVRAEIAALPKSTPLYFHCHHGGRSQAAAEHWMAQGFTDVSNIEGGIHAWSLEVDDKVPQY